MGQFLSEDVTHRHPRHVLSIAGLLRYGRAAAPRNVTMP